MQRRRRPSFALRASAAAPLAALWRDMMEAGRRRSQDCPFALTLPITALPNAGKHTCRVTWVDSKERHPCVARKGGAGGAVFAVNGRLNGVSFGQAVVGRGGGRLDFLSMETFANVDPFGNSDLPVQQKKESTSTPLPSTINKSLKISRRQPTAAKQGCRVNRPCRGFGARSPKQGCRGGSSCRGASSHSKQQCARIGVTAPAAGGRRCLQNGGGGLY